MVKKLFFKFSDFERKRSHVLQLYGVQRTAKKWEE
jgi:hypothetical protein